MQKIIDRFQNIVLPSINEYSNAEKELTIALQNKNNAELNKARNTAIRRARSASFELHHFTEFVTNNQNTKLDLGTFRKSIQEKCFFLREPTQHVEDIYLLRDIADAFKHYQLDNPKAILSNSDEIISLSTAYSELLFGEGKFEGEQVIITPKNSNKRALSSVLQNITDAWRIYQKIPLPEIGDFSS